MREVVDASSVVFVRSRSLLAVIVSAEEGSTLSRVYAEAAFEGSAFQEFDTGVAAQWAIETQTLVVHLYVTYRDPDAELDIVIEPSSASRRYLLHLVDATLEGRSTAVALFRSQDDVLRSVAAADQSKGREAMTYGSFVGGDLDTTPLERLR